MRIDKLKKWCSSRGWFLLNEFPATSERLPNPEYELGYLNYLLPNGEERTVSYDAAGEIVEVKK